MIALINEELKAFDDLAANFANRELSPRREQSDKYPFAPFSYDDVLEKAHEIGFLGITLSEDLGGIGQGVSALCVILNRICRADASLGTIIFTNTLAHELILKAGGEDLLRDIISSAKKPREVLIAFPAYCDPKELTHLPLTMMGKKGFVLSGNIDYMVLAGIATHALVPSYISGQENYSLFLVKLPGERVKIGEPIFSHGVHACPAADMAFENAEAVLVGQQGQGNACFEDIAGRMHAAAAAMSAGVMRGSFDYALAYCNEREQGGRPISNWSEMKMILANMAVQLNVADMAVSGACNSVEKKTDGWNAYAKAAALHVQEAACHLTTDGVQVLGGYGYMKDYGQEKRFRDAKQLNALLGHAPLRKIRFIEELNSRT
jgi:alkylation response protein AidB-like acyl-CoA dehydrogenase